MSSNVPKIKLRLSEAALAAPAPPSTTSSTSHSQLPPQVKLSASKRKDISTASSASSPTPSRNTSNTGIAASRKKSLLSSVVSSPVKSELSDIPSTATTAAANGNDVLSAVTAQNSSVISAASSKSATTSKRKLPSTLADSAAGLFGDYLTALQAARGYTLRRSWRLQSVTLKNVNGYELGGLTEWVTKQPALVIAERNKSAAISRLSPQRKQRVSSNRRQQPYDVFDIESIAATINTSSGAGEEKGTFVCTHEGCHQIFDDRIRWRRHQNGHIRHHNRTKQHQLA